MNKSLRQNPQDYEALRLQAAILFIKHGEPVRSIVKKLGISNSVFNKWSKAYNWNDLRQTPVNQKQEAAKHKAAVLYIKGDVSLRAISEQLKISVPTLTKWNKAGRWAELRPDLELLKQHKAAGMYVDEGIKESDIAQLLSVPELTVKMWAYLNGWDAAKLIKQAKDVTADIVAAFCNHYKSLFPEHSSEIEVAQQYYIKKITPKI